MLLEHLYNAKQNSQADFLDRQSVPLSHLRMVEFSFQFVLSPTSQIRETAQRVFLHFLYVVKRTKIRIVSPRLKVLGSFKLPTISRIRQSLPG